MASKPKPQTLVYKRIGLLEVPLDVYLPSNSKPSVVLIWFHGGGLLQGRRDSVPPHLLNSVELYQHALISADYRLAPQATVEQICEDVKDCITYARDPAGLRKALNDGISKVNKVAVSGGSAGGYLAFLAGLYCEPKPDVILPIYPITDPLGYFFTNPQPYPLLKPAGQVDHNKFVKKEQIAEFVDPRAEQVANCPRDSARSQFYFYMMAEANLAQLLGMKSGKDAYESRENDRWRVAKALAARGLPPTYVVHGALDRAVGVEQADEVVGAMIGLGLEVRYERIADQDHLFDMNSEVKMEKMYDFMYRQLQDGKL